MKTKKIKLEYIALFFSFLIAFSMLNNNSLSINAYSNENVEVYMNSTDNNVDDEEQDTVTNQTVENSINNILESDSDLVINKDEVKVLMKEAEEFNKDVSLKIINEMYNIATSNYDALPEPMYQIWLSDNLYTSIPVRYGSEAEVLKGMSDGKITGYRTDGTNPLDVKPKLRAILGSVWDIPMLNQSDGRPVYCVDGRLGYPSNVNGSYPTDNGSVLGGAKDYIISNIILGYWVNAENGMIGSAWDMQLGTGGAIWYNAAEYRGDPSLDWTPASQGGTGATSAYNDSSDAGTNMRYLVGKGNYVPQKNITLSKTVLDSLPMDSIETINGVIYQVSEWTDSKGSGTLTLLMDNSNLKYQTKNGGNQVFDLNANKANLSVANNSIRFLNPDLSDNSKSTGKGSSDLKKNAILVSLTPAGEQNYAQAYLGDPILVPSISVQWHARLINIELTKSIIEADGTVVDPQPNLEGKITFELWKKIGSVPNSNTLKSIKSNEPDETRKVLDDGTVIEYVGTESLNADNKAQFNELYAFDDNGNDIIYYWHELVVPDEYNKISGYNQLPPLGEYAGTTYITEIENTVARFPELHTTATTPEGGKEVPYNQDVTIVDTVEYIDLQPNKEYTLEGVIMDKSTGLPLLDYNGNEIRSEVVFTPTESNGAIEVSFSFNTTGMAGKEIVVFEYLKSDDKPVVEHTDIEDEGQTIKVQNEPIIELPMTGENMKEFAIIGAILLSASSIVMIILVIVEKTNKRRNEGEENEE